MLVVTVEKVRKWSNTEDKVVLRETESRKAEKRREVN